MSLLLINASVITCDENGTVIKDGAVGIKDGIIDYAGPVQGVLAENYERVINIKGKAIMPGFVNAHNHAAMTMFRNYADDLKLMDWLFNKIFPLEDKLTEEDAYWASSLAMLEMIKGGTTAFCDMYMFMDKTAEAVAQCGMRAALGRGLQGESVEGPDHRVSEALALYKNFHNSCNGRIRVNLAAHSVYTCSFPYLEKVARLAREIKADIHIHLSETTDEVKNCIEKYGVSPVKLADKAGLLSERTIAAHCVVVDEEDMELLKEKKVNVVHNPGSNMKLASGIAPIKAMADLGINIALGTDGASSNNNLDMLEEMRAATYLQKVITKDPTALPVDQVLRMATVNGARALGFDNVGEIKKGVAADLIVINTDKPWYYPKYNEKSAIVYSGNFSDVEFVIIDGNIVMEKGQILTMDEERILYEVQKRAY
ncbi:amidohydrolase [Lutispora thermophila]|uniref:5-methylthioadenosine/S-adenosylhomocysteine deaminase n=1 Tax=Lutispora thermophila DSM 19022 TaxID=1122184 RepID=A0A1M6B3P8_9FIRM|nr:amidohydrolase [Lutispora thermophila]SHI43300.1 5-methylthioadenosine/S-adenosylhomocysteine deaminase [Lutispora thermophila DSM 19022]